MTKATIEIKGERFVLIPEAEYEAELAATLPPLPPKFPDGTREARACIRVSIARDIIQERRELGLTQTQLAKLAGIRQETLSRLESGKHRPNERTVERIEAAFKRARGKRVGNKKGAELFSVDGKNRSAPFFRPIWQVVMRNLNDVLSLIHFSELALPTLTGKRGKAL